MKLFIQWLKDQKGTIFLLVVFFLIFSVLFWLENTDVSYVLYPAFLCLIILVLVGVFSFYRYRKRVLNLERIRKDLSLSKLDKPQGSQEDLYQKILFEQQKSLKQLEQDTRLEKEQMMDYFGVWIHQIKIPITSMDLYLQNNPEKSDELKTSLRQIERYVNLSMAYLRLNAPQSDYVFHYHDLDEIIRQELVQFAPDFISRKIGLDFRETHLRVLSDQKWLSLVIDQLLSNALKYSKTGTIHIYAQENQLIIEDEGIGIRKEDLQRILEKGFTGINGHQENKSSGIGLWICRKVCRDLSIRFFLQSEYGKGTKAFLEFNPEHLSLAKTDNEKTAGRK